MLETAFKIRKLMFFNVKSKSTKELQPNPMSCERMMPISSNKNFKDILAEKKNRNWLYSVSSKVSD